MNEAYLSLASLTDASWTGSEEENWSESDSTPFLWNSPSDSRWGDRD
jgi:hypothetical protein